MSVTTERLINEPTTPMSPAQVIRKTGMKLSSEPQRQPDVSVAPETQTAEAPQPEKTEMLSPQHAALARKEKFLMKQLQEIKAREDALKAREAEYESSYVSKAKLKERAKLDPLGMLTDVDLTPDEFTQALLNSSPQDSNIRKLEAKIQELESKLSGVQTESEKQQKTQYDQAVNQIRNDVKALVDSSETFEAIKLSQSHNDVVELIEEVFHKGWEAKNLPAGTILPIEQAAQVVEDHLLEEALKTARLKKVQEKLNPAPQEIEATKPQQTQQQQPIKTLTHATTSTPSKPLSDKDRVQRAILAFKGQLK